MPKRTRIKLILFAVAYAMISIVCTSSYITPASLTATAGAPAAETNVPTAYFVLPTDTLPPPPTSTNTPDPGDWTPTPEFDTPTPLPSLTPTETLIALDKPPLVYYAQAGDSLPALAARFSVHPFEIISPDPIPETGFINPGQMLMIPQRLLTTTAGEKIIPDSEVVFSPTAAGFDTGTFIDSLETYITDYREYVYPIGMATGAEIILQAAQQDSINPRLLIALLEYNSHWIFGRPGSFSEEYYPMGYVNTEYSGLDDQLSWAIDQISIGYYGWRDGSLTGIKFKDGTSLRLDPTLNAGTVGLMYYFSKIYNKAEWEAATDPESGFIAVYNSMFEDAWARAALVEPLFPDNFTQPALILPFATNQTWAFTGGPHGAWSALGPWAALDFAPGSLKHGCAPSDLWVTAVASGVIARMDTGILMLDLDGDGLEQTGWVIFYLHLSPVEGLEEGDWVDKDDWLGHPSCEGGRATGTHIHIARKFNGEWILADGPVPFELSEWQAHNGEEAYEGTLTKGDQIIEASPSGEYSTRISREDEEDTE